MFVRAIEVAAEFTRPIHSIERFYGSTNILPGAATLFFVNQDGWALTCRHVAERIIVADQMQQRKIAFEKDYSSMQGKKKEKQIKRELEQKYQLSYKIIYEIRNLFVNCVQGNLDIEIKLHNSVDVALIHFRNFTQLMCNSFPTFAANSTGLKQGKFLCRLGFPFPEFTNFEYKPNSDTIDWNQTGKTDTPRFPIEGMVTRHLLGPNAQIIGFEMSTPGLRGQSGGPAFDAEGKIWGMQSATNHLDLNFDINMEVIRGGQKKTVKDSAFLHVGHCIHVDILKDFMVQNNVNFIQG
jgi:hypothetical protein